MNKVDNLRIAITGASGFIGARIVEYLNMTTQSHVNAVTRAFSSLGRLAELNQERLTFCKADICNRQSIGDAIKGCDIVIHCAYGSDGSEEARWQTTVEGTRNLVEEAAKTGIRRIVHVSTSAIHDTRGQKTLHEWSPILNTNDKSYESSKIAAENIVDQSQLEAVILRPTIVYGPWGKDWTTTPFTRLAKNVKGLPSGPGWGTCNAVYVDDVVRAVLSACLTTNLGSFIIASDTPVTWGDFYDSFRKTLKIDPNTEAGDIEAWELELYKDSAVANTARAETQLGYRSSVSFAVGMQRVQEWAKWYGLINQAI